VLVVTARRRAALVRSGVRADVVVGSARDPREASRLADYPVAPGALVLTAGAAPGTVETAAGVVPFAPPPKVTAAGGAYGAGDSFAAALTFALGRGLAIADALRLGAECGAAVLRRPGPYLGQLSSDELPLPYA
jgi:ribokinase